MANQSHRWEEERGALPLPTVVRPVLPPGFVYAVAGDEDERAPQPLIPYPQPVRPQLPGPRLPPPAQMVLEAYPTRRRVRVRRRSRWTALLHGWGQGGRLLLLLLLLGGGLGGGAYYYHSLQVNNMAARLEAESAERSDQAAVVPANAAAASDLVADPNAVIARAVVKPLRAAALGLTSGGRVKELLVREGDLVSPGQGLIRLDDQRQLVAVAQARAELAQADAQWRELQAGARTEEIAQAQAVVDAAQARLDTLLHDEVQVADETAGLAAVAAAEARLQDLHNGPDEATLISARAEMRKAQAAVTTAQAAYDAVVWRSDIAMLPEATQLEQATIAYEAAKAQYDELSIGPDQAQISAAIADIETARADLARIRTPAQASEIEAARAEVRQAQAQLDLLLAGTRSEALLAAEAAVGAAQANVMAAEVALGETLLTAPFTGTVAALAVEVGEQVAPGAAVVQLGDLAAWQLETDDLIELDVVRVQPGAPVAVTVDALPGVELRGTVARVKPFGEDKVGDMTYTAYITLDEQAAALAWNMTATVYIGAQE